MLLGYVFCAVALDGAVVGIDIGGQYIKAAKSTVSGAVNMVIDRKTNRPSTPASVALKCPRNTTFPLEKSDFANVEIKYGVDARRILKNRPGLGFEFLPRILGRNESASEFGKSIVSNSTALFSFMLDNYVRSMGDIDGFSVVVPFFWTKQQIKSITSSCEAFSLPFRSVVSDITALTQLYAGERNARFAKRPLHVLFVDVGGVSAKAFGARFYHRSAFNLINQTGSAWSEKTGGYHFAKKIAADKEISLGKAQKLLMMSEDPKVTELFRDELDEIERVVGEAFAVSVKIAGKIDEVQLLGGASSVKSVMAAVKRMVNGTTVKRDMNAHEAIARGGVIAAMEHIEMGIYRPSVVVKRAVASMNLTCNTTSVFCKKHSLCPNEVVENSGGCREARIVAQPEDVPEGIDHVLARVSLPGFEPVESDNASMKFALFGPDPMVMRVDTCVNETCTNITFKTVYQNIEEMQNNGRFLMTYLKEQNERKKRIEPLNEIFALLDVIESILGRSKDIAVEAVEGVTEEMWTTYETVRIRYETGELAGRDPDELVAVIDSLKGVKKSLYL